MLFLCSLFVSFNGYQYCIILPHFDVYIDKNKITAALGLFMYVSYCSCSSHRQQQCRDDSTAITGFLLHHEITEVVFNHFLTLVSSCKPEMILYLFIVFTLQTSQLFYFKNISRIIQAWNHRQEAEERFPGILFLSSCLFWGRRKCRENILADVLLLPSSCFKTTEKFLSFITFSV